MIEGMIDQIDLTRRTVKLKAVTGPMVFAPGPYALITREEYEALMFKAIQAGIAERIGA